MFVTICLQEVSERDEKDVKKNCKKRARFFDVRQERRRIEPVLEKKGWGGHIVDFIGFEQPVLVLVNCIKGFSKLRLLRGRDVDPCRIRVDDLFGLSLRGKLGAEPWHTPVSTHRAAEMRIHLWNQGREETGGSRAWRTGHGFPSLFGLIPHRDRAQSSNTRHGQKVVFVKQFSPIVRTLDPIR
mmetsp:Transcript_10245/g.23999  ORF Transcript_10245/g.23999 Transcript_10245/m.23999 type:complete len:184 (+) Transcript_10245:847-1398(+)